MKKIITILMLICCFVFSMSAGAAETAAVSATIDVNDFSVEVVSSGLTPLGRISVYARKAGSSIASSLEDASGVYAGQFFADSDGNFDANISFVETAVSGEYIISIADDFAQEVYESGVFVYRTPGDMEDAIDAVNKATSANMTAVIDSNKDALLLDTAMFDDMSKSEKDKVSKMLANERPSSGFKTVAELHTAFGACVASVEINSTDFPEELIRKYADELGISIELLDDCSKDEIKEAMKILQNEEYENPEELKNLFEEAVFAGKVNAASTAGEIRKLFLETYADKLSLDLKDYNKLSAPSKVFVEIKNKKVTGFDDAKDKFYDAVRALKNNDGSSSGGSSGGGGGGGYPSVPAGSTVLPQPENGATVSVFGDLGSVEWAKSDIEYLNAKGIVSGDGNGNFRPGDTVTRAEFIKMITLAFGFELNSATSGFADVSPSSWYATYVASGVDAGIINGIGNGLFAPDATITRQDLALICYRAVNASNLILDNVRDSVPADYALVSDYASEAVEAFFKSGIISGDPSGAFRPGDGATRAEVSKIIASLMRVKEVQG